MGDAASARVRAHRRTAAASSTAITIRFDEIETPVRVTLSAPQRDGILRAAMAAGRSVAGWARPGIYAAAAGRTFAEAAASAGLEVPAWIRAVLLERAGVTEFRIDLARAMRDR